MTKALSIVRPLPINVLGGTLPGVANLATMNPKEIAGPSAIGSTIDIDLASGENFDTIIVGYSNAAAGAAAITGTYGAAAYTTTVLAGGVPLAGSGLIAPRPHYFTFLAAPVNARYVRLTFPAANISVGVLGIGKAFQCALGHEFGAGRGVEDTSTVERLFGGGFGINEGAIVGGYDWTFGDLTAAERESLYALVFALGQSKTVLVAEDPDLTAGLNERLHWGLFDRLEKYERTDPAFTKWSFRVKDWG